MHILCLSDVYFPRVNGVSTSISVFRDSLRELGHRMTLMAPDYGIDRHAEEDILRVSARDIPFDPEDRRMSRRAMRRSLAALDPASVDVVHIQTPFVAHRIGLEYARRHRLPVVESYHTYFEEYLYHYVPVVPRAAMRALARWISRRDCNQVDAVVVPSSAMRDALQGYGVRRPTHVIPTGLRLEDFEGGSRRRFCEEFGIEADRPICVHVGRVAFEKNIGFLLQVIERLRKAVPDILLVVAGEGPARPALQRQSRRLGLARHVLFVDYLQRGRPLWDCYSAGDAFVFASTTETQGLVLLEAMALGVPVVSVSHLGARDILESRRGAVVARLEVNDFAARLRTVLTDRALRRRLGEEARMYVREWRASVSAMRMVDMYRGLITESVSRPSPGVTTGAAAQPTKSP